MGTKAIEYRPYLNYDPLQEGCIRLLKIHPSSNAWDIETNPSEWNIHDEIEISLVSVPLDECPPFVALSYSWGEPGPFVDPTTSIFTQVARCFPIKCQGRLILGTRNLRSALRRLRQSDYIQKMAPPGSPLAKMAEGLTYYTKNTHLYWIDAICIDQSDLQERSEQVLHMCRIYRQAQCTVAWLGETDAYTAQAIQAMIKVTGYSTKDAFLSRSNPLAADHPFKGVSSLNKTELMALAMLLARSWFSRTWIL
jgi:Heterokaryon incompatibility protein (HET)